MNTLELVDAEQRAAVAASAGSDPEDDLAAFRAEVEAGTRSLVTPEPVLAQDAFIPGPPGAPDVRVRIHRPEGDRHGVGAILYAHGGGLVAGTPDMMDGWLSRIARETGNVVVAVDYRLAPEHPFPAALDDFRAALTWLVRSAGELGASPSRIAVMGDSGGGNLAAAVALWVRDKGGPDLRAQILMYPMLDMRTGHPGHLGDPLTGRYVWTRERNRFSWRALRGAVAMSAREIGYLSPTLADDLSGLPPAFVLTGSLDLYREEDSAYAQRLLARGVSTDLFVFAGAVHGFDMRPGALGEQARELTISTIRRLMR